MTGIIKGTGGLLKGCEMIIKDKHDLRANFTALYKKAEYLLSCGKTVEADVKEYIQKRTVEQNAYYWLMCGEIGSFLDEAGLTYGEYELKYNSDLIHDINKAVFGLKTTTKMNIKEFCDYITKIIEFWQEKTNYQWIPSETPVSYFLEKGYSEKDLM